MSRKRSAEEQLEVLQQELIEDVLAADAATLDEMVREGGQEPAAVDDEVRQLLDASTRKFHARRREALKKNHARDAARLAERRRSLPSTTSERRALLERAIRLSPTAAAALTLQFRDFRELTDEDVSSQLSQLAELGALPPDDDPDAGGDKR